MSNEDNFLTRRARQMGESVFALRRRVRAAGQELLTRRKLILRILAGKPPAQTVEQKKLFNRWAWQFGLLSCLLAAVAGTWLPVNKLVAIQLGGFMLLPTLLVTFLCIVLAAAPVKIDDDEEVDHA